MAKIAIFASGNGSNFEAIVLACKNGILECDIVGLIVDNPSAFAITRAEKLGIKYYIVNPKDYQNKQTYEQAIISKIGKDLDLIVLAGYMRLIGEELLAIYPDKIMNIHPSLLPKYKGLHAFRRSYESDDLELGATVHFVNADLDSGTIISQSSFDKQDLNFIEAEDYLHQIEHQLYTQAIKKILEERR
ncbi:MAG: phosphoribosylglycinamide formyltransferase [Erysipelotrichaceae bacterium]